ncbi:hypothetical protein J3458_000241 [Metarhizium acridum]|uniref:uncharacterized protein n=1 Tax=Metarhizium acridum TaxID=92637 RepID=UPI001C6A9956|nr:hypothetical protein J3458_000241 [Metarhizium acridum]
MSQKIWQRKFEAGLGLEKTLAATRSSGRPVAVESPPTNVRQTIPPASGSGSGCGPGIGRIHLPSLEHGANVNMKQK